MAKQSTEPTPDDLQEQVRQINEVFIPGEESPAPESAGGGGAGNG